MITKTKFSIYSTIFYIIDNCRIVKEDSTGITVEICLDEHRDLLEDLITFLQKKLKQEKQKQK